MSSNVPSAERPDADIEELQDAQAESLSDLESDSSLEFGSISLERWQDYVQAHPDRCVFHDRRWMELLSNFYRLPLQVLAVSQGEQIKAAIPLMQTKSWSNRKKIISLPFSDHVPVLFENVSDLTTLLSGVQRVANSMGCLALVRTSLPFANAADCGRIRHTLQLTESIDELRNGYTANARQNLRKASSRDLQFTAERSMEAMESFYALHVRTRRKIGIPVQSRSFFRLLHEKLIVPGLGYVALARLGHEVLAAGLCFEYHDTVICKYAASDPKRLSNRPNEFLFDNIFRRSIEEGYRYFDFGIMQADNNGLRRFKMKWGCQEYWAPEIDLLDFAINRQTLPIQLVAPLVRNSPPAVCRILGSLLYKYSQ